MLDQVERRFEALRAPHQMQWLADNGSPYTAAETVEFAKALNLVACFTPVRSPESNGVCEAFVKTFKRNYAAVNPRPDAISVLQRLGDWFEDHNTIHPHSGLVSSHPLSSSRSNPATKQSVRFHGGHSTECVLDQGTAILALTMGQTTIAREDGTPNGLVSLLRGTG
jgi:hypothetical protein